MSGGRAAIVLFSVLVSVNAFAQTRVLFIGNSYTYVNDLPGMFDALATSLGEDVVTAMSAPGGYTFNLHTQNSTTTGALAQGDWDFVVLQEQSQLPSFPQQQVESECFPYAAQLVDLARQANPCVEPVFLMTWGRENGDDQNCASWPPVCTYEGMQGLLRERYLQMASDNSAACAPAGAVWQQHRVQFPLIGLYTDGSHPNALGSYIAATSLFSTIFRRASEGSNYVPTGVDPAQASVVRSLASSIVLDSATIWNIGANDPIAVADWTPVGATSIQFADNSVGASAWAWDFGDGGTSSDPDPLHIYPDLSAYPVTLIVTDACGRSDTSEFTVNLATGITDEATADATVLFSTSCRCMTVLANAPLWLELTDGAGRLMARERISPPMTTVPLPHMKGCLIWRASNATGAVRSGRYIVPR